MRIVTFDQRKGTIVVIPEDPDDFWTLYNVVRSKDLVRARTTREVRKEQEGARPTQGKRITLDLTLRAEKVSFQQVSDRLRISGYVVEAPEKYGLLGSHHTLSISSSQKVTITKDEWSSYDLERIKKAAEDRYVPITVVALDDEDGAVTVLRQHSIFVVGEIQAHLPGKLDTERREEAATRYYAALLGLLEVAWKQTHGLIAIVGPGFWKESFASYVRNRAPEVAKNITAVAMVSSGGVQGVGEALRSGVLGKVMERNRIAVETQAVEKVLARLGSQQGDVTYGPDNVEKAVTYGAVEELLVTDRFLRESPDNERRHLENLMRDVERMKGKILIVNAEHEAGQKLTALGGAAALLRFRVE